MKILVADDDPTCRAVIAIRLKAMGGIEVMEAADGDEALSILKSYPCEGAILDWQMPGKTGLELVKVLRAAGYRIPVLMVTAEAERERVVEAIRAGVSDYLIKPFDPNILLRKLQKFVQQPFAPAPRSAAVSP